MKNLLAFLLIILLPILLIAQTNPVNQSFVLTHVTVIDMTGTPPKPDMTVVIAGNRIAALGRTGVVSVPQNARIIDATGKFLIPGLWDMHTHTNWDRKSREVEDQFFPLFIANGVTGMREMGSLFSIERFNRWRAASATDKLLAPRIVVGKMVAGPGDSSLAIAVRNEREAREAVRRVKREGYDFVKAHDKLSRERFLAIADEARRQSSDTCAMGSSYPIPGFSLHDELILFVQAGLTPMEALRTATYNPAKYLGLLESLGTIEQGKLADLVLLDANPLENIAHTQRINAVIVNGRHLPKETLQEILSKVEAHGRYLKRSRCRKLQFIR